MRWRTAIAVIVVGAVAPAARPACADWKVRRSPAGTTAPSGKAHGGEANRIPSKERRLRGSTTEQRAATIERLRQRARAHPDVRAYVSLARALLADGRGAEAAERFSDAIALEPSAVSPRLGRARSLMRAGQTQQALADYRAAVSMAREPSDRLASARELAEAGVASGDVEAEIEGRRALAVLRPGPGAAVELASALARGNHFREAANTLAAAPTSGGSQQEAARLALDEGRYWAAADELDHALDALERARRAAPGGSTNLRRDILASLVDVARRKGTLDVLARELDRPRDVIEWIARATVAREQGDSQGAWSSLNEAIRLRPFDIDLHRRRIDAARRVGGGVEVARLYELLAEVAIRNDDSTGLSDALDELWRRGQQDRAARIVDRVLGARPVKHQLVRVGAELAGKWGDDRRAERGWQVLLRYHPHDEAVIISLGEVRLQRGDRPGAVQVWRTLLRSSGGRAEGHARLAETLADHDFAEAAVHEARAAVALAPRQGRPRRVLASILEGQGKRREAEEAWEDVLRLARSPTGAAERREARIHLVNSWIREGAGRVATKLTELEEHLAVEGQDDDVRLCLVELYLRTDRVDRAMVLLERWWGSPAAALPTASADRHSFEGGGGAVSDSPPPGESSVEQVFTLIRLLRQRQRTAEAMSWLEAVAARFPTRAQEARLQLADIALAAHADERAATFASAAVEAEPDDAGVALRAAAIEERLGNLAGATRTYRRLLGTKADAAGLVALAAFMSRTGGEPMEQRALLRRALEHGSDDELLGEAGRRAIALEEALGSLDDLAAELADVGDLNASHVGGAARRRVLALILTRLVPAAYHARDQDPTAAARLRRYGRDGVRPLLDLVSGAEGAADIEAIEALGMLGHSEASAELTRLLIADEVTVDTALNDGGRTVAAGAIQLRTSNSDVARAIIVALGRLGGDAARTTLEAVAKVPRPGFDAALLWSLGRVGSPLGAELAMRELGHSSTETSLIACLTLGRAGGAAAATTLSAIAADPGRTPALRAAAVLGMVLGRLPMAPAALERMASGESGLASDAARAALAAAPPSGSGSPSDDAPLILGSHIDPVRLVRDLTEALVRRHGPGGQPPP